MKNLKHSIGLAALSGMFGALLVPAWTGVAAAPEAASDWKVLFDGKSTAGWRSFKMDSFPTNGWVVQDGWLKCVAGGRGGDIISVEEFSDFELTWEWRIPAKSNSGVKYFILETRNRAVGHEYQMVDDILETDPKQMTGSFYDVLPPSNHPAPRLAPESNHSRILVQGNHVEHWLNGVKILEYECGSAEVKAAVAHSKFKTTPGFGDKVRGHLLLTEHHDEAWFRDIRVRDLSSPVSAR